MHVITVVFEVKPEAREAFRTLVLQQAKNSLENEAGCHRFDVCFAEERPDSVFLYEVYEDEAAFDRHCQTGYFAAFREATAPLLASRTVQSWQLQVPT